MFPSFPHKIKKPLEIIVCKWNRKIDVIEIKNKIEGKEYNIKPMQNLNIK